MRKKEVRSIMDGAAAARLERQIENWAKGLPRNPSRL